MNNGITVDREFHALIPQLRGDEYEQLEASIATEGCRDALVVWDGKILDGHNRREICERVNKPYRTKQIELPDRAAARLWILENQMGRRNLTDDQRAVLAARLAKLKAAASKKERTKPAREAKKAKRAGSVETRVSSTEKVRARKESSRAFRVSERRTRAAMRLSEEKAAAILAGKVTLKEAAREARHEVRSAERTAKAAAAAVLTADDDCGVRIGDFREIAATVPGGSVELIFTDPPYSRKCAPLYGELASVAVRILKPGGSLIAYAGQYMLHEILPAMAVHLRPWWIIACQHSSRCARMTEYGIVVKWKPLIWMVNGTRRDKLTFVDDLLAGAREKESHKWQQAEAEAATLIEKLTDRGDFVFDPFCGGGTTAVACKRAGRRWLTCDIDAQSATIARGRIKKA